MNDNIRPIRVHPRTAEVMREIGMAMAEMVDGLETGTPIVIDENVLSGGAIVMPKDVSTWTNRWTWKKSTVVGNTWSAKLETDNGVAHMHMVVGHVRTVLDLRAWDQKWEYFIQGGGTIDQHMRAAEEWANKILEYWDIPTRVEYGSGCLICGSSEPHEPHQITGTTEPPWNAVATGEVGGVEERSEDAKKAEDLTAQLHLRIAELEGQVHRQATQIRKARKALKKENP